MSYLDSETNTFNIQTNIGIEMVIDENSLTSLAFTSDKENIYALECLNTFAGGTILCPGGY